jgi:alpha-1,3-mannosyltransferase
MILRFLTDGGASILRAQYIFAAFHALLVFLVMGSLYYSSESNGQRPSKQRSPARRETPFWVGLLLVLSRRVHSIFALRLFNDGVAMMLLYLCVFLLVRRKWTLGTVVFR